MTRAQIHRIELWVAGFALLGTATSVAGSSSAGAWILFAMAVVIFALWALFYLRTLDEFAEYEKVAQRVKERVASKADDGGLLVPKEVVDQMVGGGPVSLKPRTVTFPSDREEYDETERRR